MTCYYKDEKATADTLKDGWLYTGDMAKEDEDGFLFLVDRKKDVIISGGEEPVSGTDEDFLRGAMPLRMWLLSDCRISVWERSQQLL